jgi:NADH-quinone oxidoreductase subunit L
VGAAINLLFGAVIQKRFGKPAIHTIAVGTMVLSSLTALYYFFTQLLPADPSQRFLLNEFFPMMEIGAVRVTMAFAMDPLGGVMACMVTVVATAIHIYSIGYMHDEPSYWRFFGYLNLFCFSMLMLVLGDNFVLMFFGWEGVGLCSYLLIGFGTRITSRPRPG